MTFSGFLWLLAVAGGPVLMGLIFAFALLRRRKLQPDERRQSRNAVHAMYRGDAEEKDTARKDSNRP